MAERRVTVEVPGGTATVTAPDNKPVWPMKPCRAGCGKYTDRGWCSMSCYRADEGDERYDDLEDGDDDRDD